MNVIAPYLLPKFNLRTKQKKKSLNIFTFFTCNISNTFAISNQILKPPNPQITALHFPPLRRTLNFSPNPSTDGGMSPAASEKSALGAEANSPPCAARLNPFSFWPEAVGIEAKRSSLLVVCWSESIGVAFSLVGRGVMPFA